MLLFKNLKVIWNSIQRNYFGYAGKYYTIYPSNSLEEKIIQIKAKQNKINWLLDCSRSMQKNCYGNKIMCIWLCAFRLSFNYLQHSTCAYIYIYMWRFICVNESVSSHFHKTIPKGLSDSCTWLNFWLCTTWLILMKLEVQLAITTYSFIVM